jgi:hypothetical protein
VLAVKALRFVNTEQLTAFRATPPFFLLSDEMPDAKIHDAFEIVDHAHAVVGSIPLVQMFQPGTGEAVTTGAVPDFGVRNPLTVFDSAFDAGF